MLDQEEQQLPLYSKRAILGGTFFGGPLVTGILMRRNFINLYKEKQGNLALYISIAVTVILFSILLSLPETVMSHFPSYVIPAIYTAIAGSLVNHYMGRELEQHKNFYSGWRVFGFTLIGLAILTGAIFGYAYYVIATNKYDQLLVEFQQNEEKALKFYEIYEKSSSQELGIFIDKEGMPAWKRNLAIVDKMDEEAPDEQYLRQDQILREYCQLRIQFFEVYKKVIRQNTQELEEQLESLNKDIEAKIGELK